MMGGPPCEVPKVLVKHKKNIFSTDASVDAPAKKSRSGPKQLSSFFRHKILWKIGKPEARTYTLKQFKNSRCFRLSGFEKPGNSAIVPFFGMLNLRDTNSKARAKSSDLQLPWEPTFPSFLGVITHILRA